MEDVGGGEKLLALLGESAGFAVDGEMFEDGWGVDCSVKQ